jgi:hypothetical protein
MASLLEELREATAELLKEARHMSAAMEENGLEPLDESIERRVTNVLLDCDAAA